jgi:hypothetical protein
MVDDVPPEEVSLMSRSQMEKNMRGLSLVIAGQLLAATTVYAHHAYASAYDNSQEITLRGQLVWFEYRNPHSFVHVAAPDEKGVMQRWAVEWSGSGQLTNQGVTRDSLKVGDEVIIVARPSRMPGDYRALMVTLKRPSDGFTWACVGTCTGIRSVHASD